jgi:adenine deaminase
MENWWLKKEKRKLSSVPAESINQFDCAAKEAKDFAIRINNVKHNGVLVIEALDGQLITNKLSVPFAILKETMIFFA